MKDEIKTRSHLFCEKFARAVICVGNINRSFITDESLQNKKQTLLGDEKNLR